MTLPHRTLPTKCTHRHTLKHTRKNQSESAEPVGFPGVTSPRGCLTQGHGAAQLSICPTHTHSHCMCTSYMKHLDCKSLFVCFWPIKAAIIQTHIQSQRVGALAGECNQLFFLFSALSPVRSLQQWRSRTPHCIL